MSSYRPLSQDANQRFPSSASEHREDAAADARSVASSTEEDEEEELAADDPQFPNAPPPLSLHRAFEADRSPAQERASIGSRDSSFDRVIDLVKGLGTRSRAGSTQSYERVDVDGIPARSRKNSKASGHGDGFMGSPRRVQLPTLPSAEKEHIAPSGPRDLPTPGSPRRNVISATDGPSTDGHARPGQLGLQLDGAQGAAVSASTSARNHHAVERHASPTDSNTDLGERPELYVHSSGDRDNAGGHEDASRPPPNILNPHDPAFDYTHSPEGIHPALRDADQSASSTPPPVRPEPQHELEHGPVATSYSVGDIFKDFDGVHCALDDPPPPPQAERRSSQQLPNLQHPRPRSIASPPPSENPNLRYYPAPVPAVLLLPPRMAKSKPQNGRLTKVNKRASKQMLTDTLYKDEENTDDRRQSTVLDGPRSNTPGPRGSTPGPPQLGEVTHRQSQYFDDAQGQRPLSHLPPALRASQFFDNRAASTPPPSIPRAGESSAMATLDSILDASARAPAAAFTDHPITGTSATSHMRAPSTGLGNYRHSVAMTVKLHPGESPRSSMDDAERELEHLNPSPDPRESHSFEGTAQESTGPPTTLLAELESRKAQQKSRTRTAASAFPAGMHSTLLQLDAVSQVQAQSRRTKRIHLAWEDPDEAQASGSDEDVPLGLLYQQQHMARKRDDDVPLGLLMRKELEDSEPLAARRARLRAEAGLHPAPDAAPRKFLDVPLPGELPASDDDEEETLAQRIKRLKEAKLRPATSPEAKRMSAFGDGSLEIDFNPPAAAASAAATPAAIAPEDETLAQRRRRLQEEANRQRLAEEAKLVQAEVRKRQSMATILQGPGGGGYMHPHYGQPVLQPVNGGLIRSAGPQSMLRPQMSMGNIGMSGAANGFAPQFQGVSMAHFTPGMGMGVGMGMGAQDEAMNQKQREFVERWRASVMDR